MRDFDNLPLLTPYEAFERAWETDRRRPTFDFDYRVRGPKAWKTIETLLRPVSYTHLTLPTICSV